MSGRPVRVDAVAWITGLLPLAIVHICYLISATAELVPWCNPYFDGCTSISRAARQDPVIHLFRAVMLPSAALLMLYWWLASEWLRGFVPQAPRRRQWMLVLGVIGTLFLIVYVTALGEDGLFYRWMRRYGVTIHFSFTAMAQLLLMSLILRDARLHTVLRHAKLFLCLALLGLGLLSIPLQHLVPVRAVAMNALEWNFALLMAAYFPLTGLAWRRTGFRIQARWDA
jgi:hypothetical protein